MNTAMPNLITARPSSRSLRVAEGDSGIVHHGNRIGRSLCRSGAPCLDAMNGLKRNDDACEFCTTPKR